MKIIIIDTDNGPAGKVADAEIHFTDGPMQGLKLIGFAIWEKRDKKGFNVTFPARQYSVNGERRSFALLRPVADASPLGQAGLSPNAVLTALILDTYHDHTAREAAKEDAARGLTTNA